MNTPAEKVNLLDFDRKGLRDFFAQIGEKPYRAEQVMKWIYHRLESDFENMTDVGKALREKLSASCYVGPPKTAFEKTQSTGSRRAKSVRRARIGTTLVTERSLSVRSSDAIISAEASTA